MNTIQTRASQIAKDTKLSIIESQMEDWKRDAEELQNKIERLSKLTGKAWEKYHLWKLAKTIKRKK